MTVTGSTPLCVGQGGTWSASYTTTCLGNPTYQWYDNSTAIQGATSSSYSGSFATAGTHTLSCKVSVGGTPGTGNLSVTVTADSLSTPTVNMSPTSPFTCDTITFSTPGSTSPCPGTITYTWTFSDNTSATGQTVTKTMLANDASWAYVTASKGTLSSRSLTRNFSVKAGAPSVTITGITISPTSPTSCGPTTLTAVTSTTCGGVPVTYTWNYGDGTTETNKTASVSHLYRAGTYTAVASAINGAGQTVSTYSQSGITVIGATVAVNPSATPNSGIADCTSISFAPGVTSNCTSGQLTYLWNFGDGKTSSQAAPMHTYAQVAAATNYTVSLTVTAADGTSDSRTLPVTISPLTLDITTASVDPSAGGTVCSAYNFTGAARSNCGSAAINYHWNFGDGTSADVASPQGHTYNGIGPNVDAQGKTYFNAQLTASIPSTVNPGQPAISVMQTIRVYVLAQTITIASMAANPNSGIGDCTPITFSANVGTNCASGALTYLWEFGDGTTSKQAAPMHTYAQVAGVTNYTAKLTVTAADGAKSSGMVTVTIYPLTLSITQASVNPTTGGAICDTFTFSGGAMSNCGGANIKYHWDFGNGEFADGATVRYSGYKSAGPNVDAQGAYYNAQLTVSIPSAADAMKPAISIAQPIKVYVSAQTVAIATLTADPTPSDICTQVTLTVNASTHCAKGITYTWNFGDGSQPLTGSNTTQSHTYSSPGPNHDANGYFYIASVTANDNTSTAVKSINIYVNPITSPDPPGSLQVTPSLGVGGLSAQVTWNAVMPAPSGYYVYKSTDAGQSWSLVATTTGTSYTDNSADGGCGYKVSAYIKCVEGGKTAPLYIDILRELKPGSGCSSCGQTGPDGNILVVVHDPVATRGYPLLNDITISSQVIETNRPMGNAAFSYDIHVGTQMKYANCVGTLHWALVDADGSRLDFGLASGAPTPERGVFSSLSATGSGFLLTGAGPPGALGSAGNFSYTFNSAGQLLQINDPAGNAQTLTYDANARLMRVLDVNTQKQITFQWTGSLISKIVQNGGAEQTLLTYSGSDLSLVQIQNAAGNTVLTSALNYNADHTFSTWTRDGDASSAKTYTYKGHPSTSCTLPVMMANSSDSSETTHIDWLGKLSGGKVDAASTMTVTNAKGGTTTIEINSLGDVTRVTPPTLTGAAAPTVTDYTYNGNRQVTSVAINGAVKQSAIYLANGLISSVTDSQNRTWSANYNGVDLTGAQDPLEISLGLTNSIFYDDANQPHVPTRFTDAAGITWSTAHNGYGQPTVVTPPTGSPLAPASITYDEALNSPTLGYALQSTDGNGDIVTYDAYDSLGDLLQASTYPVHGNNAIRNTVQFAYDAAQRVTQVTLPDGKAAQNFYVGRNLDHTIGPDGTRFNYSYCSPCGALTGITGPLGWSLGWTYDGDHDLTFFTDALSHQTQYLYGKAGEPTGSILPDGATTGVLYDNSGRVASVKNGRGHTLTLGYDALDRVQTVTPPAGTAPVSMTYNLDDSIHTITDGVGATTFTYLPNKRLSSVVYDYTVSGLTALQELDYTYFPDGARQTLTWKSGGSVVGSWNYSYDAGGRLTGISNAWSENTTWVYDGEGKLTRQQNANGTRLDIAYNQQRGWPNSLSYSVNGGAAFASYTLSYDGGANTVGNLTGVVEQDGSTAQFGYDALYRLTAEQRTGTNAQSHGYGYDLAGNRTSADGVTYGYDAANKLTSKTNAYPNATLFTYDGDGDLTSITPAANLPTYGNYAWDDYGHLTSRQEYVNPAVNYGYDAGGHRIWMQPVGTGTTRTFYIFDGDLLLGEVQPSGTGTTIGAAYTWGADGLVSERLNNGGADLSSGRSLWYAYGPGGETRQLTNGSGAVVDTYGYTAYGVQTAGTGSDANPFRYGGQVGYYTDASTGSALILCTHRWYSPVLGRWLSRDPIGYEGGENLYAYVDNNPENLFDPTGLDWIDNVSDFCAGFGDSLTFEITGGVRRLINKAWNGSWDDLSDANSGYYFAGEWIETAGEIALTFGSAALKKAAAKKTGKIAQTEARAFLRKTKQLNGCTPHHINPLSGHPVNITQGIPQFAQFPVGGLPAWIHSSPLNIKKFAKTAEGIERHMKAHRRLMSQEKAFRRAINPAMTSVRAIRNWVRHPEKER